MLAWWRECEDLILVENFFHASPPFSRGAVFERVLAGFAFGPPALGHRVGGEAGHVASKVGADIFEVAEQVVGTVWKAAKENGVVADVSLVNDAENVGPDRLVKTFILVDFIRTKSDHAAVSLGSLNHKILI